MARGVREQRLVTRCPAVITGHAGTIAAETEDLSMRGAFVRTEFMLPLGSVVSLAILLPAGNQITFVARVAHVLMPAAAKALGRHAGIGFELSGQGSGFDELRAHLNAVQHETTNPGVSVSSLALIAEPSEPLRARIARCLERTGFEVRTYSSGAAALSAAVGWKPNVVVSALDMDGMSGIDLALAMADHQQMSTVPLVLTCDSPSDMARLEAFRAGVRDIIPRPFLDEELMIRIHRVTSVPNANISLRGSLSDVAIGTLLSLFEFERKSGVLLLVSGTAGARLFVSDGKILRIEGGGAGVARQRLFRVLDWKEGQFEFSAGAVKGVDEVGASTTNILLQHAQASDEASA